jgi:hypothetical protein
VAGSAEPTAWQATATDTTASLQAPGALAVAGYVSGSATTLPIQIGLDDYWAGASGSSPQID